MTIYPKFVTLLGHITRTIQLNWKTKINCDHVIIDIRFFYLEFNRLADIFNISLCEFFVDIFIMKNILIEQVWVCKFWYPINASVP